MDEYVENPLNLTLDSGSGSIPTETEIKNDMEPTPEQVISVKDEIDVLAKSLENPAREMLLLYWQLREPRAGYTRPSFFQYHEWMVVARSMALVVLADREKRK